MKALNRIAWIRKIACAAFCAGAIGTAHAEVAERKVSNTSPIRVASYNIRGSGQSEPSTEREWPNRRAEFLNFVKGLDFDIYGFQEVMPDQRTYMSERMSEWTFIGDHRNANRTSGEANPIAFRTARFDLLSTGTFWLSTTPETPGSKSWSTSLPRICTWAILRDRIDGQEFLFANTHLDHQSTEARNEGITLIRQRIKEYANGLPIILTGDHNASETSHEQTLARQAFKDGMYASKTTPEGPWASCNGFVGSADLEDPASYVITLSREERVNGKDGDSFGNRIDYIYVSSAVEVESYRTYNDRMSGTKCHFSDHFLVGATLSLHSAGTVGFVGEIAKGTNYASAVATVKSRVTSFCGVKEPATVTVTLRGEDGSEAVRTHEIANGDESERIFAERFDNLAAGVRYVVTAKLETSDFATLAERPFMSAKERTLFDESGATFPNAGWTAGEDAARAEGGAIVIEAPDEPRTPVVFTPAAAGEIANEEVLIRSLPHPYTQLSAVPPVTEGRAAVAFIAAENQDQIEAIVWRNGEWTRTGALVTRGEECEALVSFTPETVTYRLRAADAGWTLAGEGTLAESGAVTKIEAFGHSTLAELSARATDANLIADAAGCEYADLKSALTAGAKGPFSPLWFTAATLPTEKLGVLDVVDPLGYLSLAGGQHVLRRESGADGVTRLYYGKSSPDDAERSRYLKTSCELGLAELLTETSEVKLSALAASADGTLSFTVGVDGERVTSEKIGEFVRVREDLTDGDWRPPAEGELSCAGGVVTVKPNSDGGQGFVQIIIPEEE